MNYDGIWKPIDSSKQMFIEIIGDKARYFLKDGVGITYPLDLEIDSIERGHLVRADEIPNPILSPVEEPEINKA